jgi:bifunctional N-acetylglucosamine-1-phosphate-uridyltransferase/glucosamine-1-phosphate-acetyltransferase GlmU-like protein
MADSVATYSQLSPAELENVAQELITQFKGMTNDPQAQQFAQMDPHTATPEAVAQMHDYAAAKHPSILHVLSDHPVITAAVVGFGLFELKKLLDDHKKNQGQ